MSNVNNNTTYSEGAAQGAIIDDLRAFIRQTWKPQSRINYDWKDSAIRASIERRTGIECTTIELIQAMEEEGFNSLYLLHDVYFNIDAPQLTYTKPKTEEDKQPTRFTVRQRSQAEIERRKRYKQRQREKLKSVTNP